MFIVRTCQN